MNINKNSGTSNVIAVRFNPTHSPSSIDEYEEHLYSLVEPSITASDDPLADLLNEFSCEEDEVENHALEQKVDKNSLSNFYKVSFSNDLSTMCSTLSEQIEDIKNTNEKLSYYLSEMQFED